MKILKTDYDVLAETLACLIEITLNGIETRLSILLTDAELTELSPDWWLPEIEQAIKNKIIEAITPQ